MIHGFGGLNTRLLPDGAPSSTFATNGVTAINRPVSYPFKNATASREGRNNRLSFHANPHGWSRNDRASEKHLVDHHYPHATSSTSKNIDQTPSPNPKVQFASTRRG